MSVYTAILIGLIYWISASRVWYGFSIFRMPIVLAPIMGLIFNDMQNALIIGATIQMIYIGSIAPGGNPPADEGLAACIAIPVALTTHMAPEIAITLAIPLGVLGVAIENIRKTLNTTFMHMADKYAEKGDVKGIARCATIYPVLLAFPMRFLPVFIACLYGSEAIQAFLNVLPQWILNGLSVAGNILPALGIATTMIVIGKKQYLPLFIIGFFMVTYFKLSTIAIAIFGLCAIVFALWNQSTSKEA
ncbi:MAG: PTS sugar transporter subunit IIC [Erysipelotrichaceae bacterium]|nr:PTS sugar transporter subunit IIC [Erysipelotrichaceae bacterium]